MKGVSVRKGKTGRECAGVGVGIGEGERRRRGKTWSITRTCDVHFLFILGRALGPQHYLARTTCLSLRTTKVWFGELKYTDPYMVVVLSDRGIDHY
jgi:hypothetical protein